LPGLGLAIYGNTGVGICSHVSHSPPIAQNGILIANGETIIGNGLMSGQITNIMLGDDGHIGYVIDASETVIIDKLQATYITANFVGDFEGTIVQSSENIFVGV